MSTVKITKCDRVADVPADLAESFKSMPNYRTYSGRDSVGDGWDPLSTEGENRNALHLTGFGLVGEHKGAQVYVLRFAVNGGTTSRFYAFTDRIGLRGGPTKDAALTVAHEWVRPDVSDLPHSIALIIDEPGSHLSSWICRRCIASSIGSTQHASTIAEGKAHAKECTDCPPATPAGMTEGRRAYNEARLAEYHRANPLGLDFEGSASSQHYIETGFYLREGEADSIAAAKEFIAETRKQEKTAAAAVKLGIEPVFVAFHLGEDEEEGAEPTPHDVRVIEPGARVALTEDYETRFVGSDDDYFTVPKGATGTVVGFWTQCFDVHVRLDVPPTDGDDREVWVMPDSLAVSDTLAPTVRRRLIIDLDVTTDEALADAAGCLTNYLQEQWVEHDDHERSDNVRGQEVTIVPDEQTGLPTADVYRSEDDRRWVVHVDTDERTGPLTVYVNDGDAVWQGDPERDDNKATRVEVVVMRDSDSGLDVWTYLDGTEITDKAAVTVVDNGGMDLSDNEQMGEWVDGLREATLTASPDAAERILGLIESEADARGYELDHDESDDDEDDEPAEDPDVYRDNVDGHWYVIRYDRTLPQIHADGDCDHPDHVADDEDARLIRKYDGQ